jgi:hypothetical protein
MALSLPIAAYENFQQLNMGVKSFEMDSAFIKLDHQSHFNATELDKVIFQLTHTMGYKYLQNDFGIGYRRVVSDFVIGSNFFYTMTTEPTILLHQLSAGVEVFYEKTQFFYNIYLPTRDKAKSSKANFWMSPVSEFGMNFHPVKDVKVGLYPFYEHEFKTWGLNTSLSYVHKNRIEFGISPYFKDGDRGCACSIGFRFGDRSKEKTDVSHKFDGVSYKSEKILPPIYLGGFDYIEQPVQPVQEPSPAPQIKPQDKPEDKPKGWWDSYFPTLSRAG